MKTLQHFQFLLLRKVEELGPRAFPAELARQLSDSDREVSNAQVYVALTRMANQNLVASRIVFPEIKTRTRGSRRREVFRVLTLGKKALANTQKIFGTVSP